MEIIKRAEQRPTWSLVTICTARGNQNHQACGSTLKVEFDDLRYCGGEEFPWGVAPPAVSFKCPVCGAVTDLERKSWPDHRKGMTTWTSAWHNSVQSR